MDNFDELGDPAANSRMTVEVVGTRLVCTGRDAGHGMTAAQNRTARRWEVHGTVQGVGFRPFVYRLGRSLGLDGWVRNDGGVVVVEASGSAEALAEFADRVRAEAPPRAVVSAVSFVDLLEPAWPAGTGFRVAPSAGRTTAAARRIPPDLATCDACLTELFDPADRRYRYPFLNCTDCGPRATIIDTLPYDREHTTMRPFALCPQCTREYADPADRRFHAEPIACPACGPQLAWNGAGSSACGEGALQAAMQMIRDGGIVAIKGLGGYQLVCDARDEAAVARLRSRKRRPVKPFAIMALDLAAARLLADVDAAEAALLSSVARPVVLLEPVPGLGLAAAVGPGAPRLGLLLPATPLHHLLLNDLGFPLVCTSGNRAEEPIAIDDETAAERLGDIADGFLSHDRAIRSRYDDSVTRVVAGRLSVIRRARGFSPEPLPLPVPASAPLLAVGAQLKHTFALADQDSVFIGPHTGDLEQQATMDAFIGNLAHLSSVVGIEPAVVVHDLHPGYLSTQYAMSLPQRRIGVQHHHAHVASCAAEHGVTGPFIGVAYDGLGLGDDGTFWGGELFLADLAAYRRVAHFAYAPMPGGAAALRRPARMALGYLFGDPDGQLPSLAGGFLSRLPEREVATVARMIARRVNCPRASSAGRLFDAVSTLLGLCDDATYEGQAAVALEAAAGQTRSSPLPWRIAERDGLLVYEPGPTLRAVLSATRDGSPVGEIAAGFHDTIVAVTVELCGRLAEQHRVSTVCLSGGVLQNQRIATGLVAGLSAAGLRPLLNVDVPANDGGISYGQAAVAAARLRGGE